ncbi:hypothetical protein [Candidatus Poriferisocius sp.]|uniref:hypothetical protein n=1 Tax=Candidatus Poriferisocius sp. TaxID=3101276 RepID=UPI003B5AD490
MTGIKMLWHTTAMGTDYDGMLGPLQRLFGAAVMHENVSEAVGVGRRGGMVWLGDNSIEVGVPVGEQSPVRNFVEKWGGGMHSIALQVDDARATAERLARLQVTPQVWIEDGMFFSKPKETAGLLLEWSDRHTDDDPRWGHAPQPLPVVPVAPALHYAFVTAVVADPAAVAERLAGLFETEILRVTEDAAPNEIGAIVSLADCLLLLFPLPDEGMSQELWGSDITRNRFHAHGLRVENLADALSRLASCGIQPAARIAGMTYLDPDAVPIPTFLVEELLPEDPRHAHK